MHVLARPALSRTALLSMVVLISACAESSSLNPGVDAGPIDARGVDAAAPDAAPPADALASIDAGIADDAYAGADGGAIDARLRSNPVFIRTIAPSQVRAGETIMVSCQIADEMGREYIAPTAIMPVLRWSPSSSVRPMGLTAIAERAGAVEVSCGVASLSLVDETPATIMIVPGDPASVVTSVDRRQLTAGQTVNATCEIFDAFQNRVTDVSPTLDVSPQGDETINGLSATITTAGRYDVACSVPGATGAPAQIEVAPALPATLAISASPVERVYATYQTITVVARVTDRYGNEIPEADVSMASAPMASAMLGGTRFRYDTDGRYTVTAQVRGRTEGDVVLRQMLSFDVNGSGPTIDCTYPADASMLNVLPGYPLGIQGVVRDQSGLSEVSVNGVVVHSRAMPRIGPDGAFSATINTQFGINFVDIEAVDEFGARNSRTCAFLMANNWRNETALLDDAVMLKLTQNAFDNGTNPPPIADLDDLLHTALNSPQLHATLDAQLRRDPVLVSGRECLGPICISYSVRYESSRIGGPNTTTLDLVDGGLAASIEVRNISVRIGGTVSGDIRVNRANVSLIFDASLHGGRPRISVRPGSVSASVSGFSTDISGVAGWLIDILVDLFESTITGLLSDVIKNWVQDNLDDVLDGVVSSLDISTLGTSFAVPRLDGSGNINLGFGLGFTTLDVDDSRMLFGIGTRITAATAAHARPSLGVALPQGPVMIDPSATTAAVAAHIGIINQATHALWRGGLFDATLDASALGGSLPDGLEATIRTALPPVASIRGPGVVELGLGGMQVELLYPGIFDTPLAVTVGARASAPVALQGQDLSFGPVTIDRLVFSTGAADLSQMERMVLESFLRMLIQDLVDSSLNDSLPALPIPSFEIPSSLAAYGLPAGSSLGVTMPSLSTQSPHFILRGGFGVQ